MARLGPTELFLILIIVILLFGVGRVGKIASELGRGIREFRKGISEDNKEEKPESESETKS